MSAHVVVLLLTLTSLSDASAPAPECKDLIQPFVPDDPTQIFGKWVYVMGSAEPQQYHTALQSLRSSWIHVSPTSDNQTVTLRWGDYSFDRCFIEEVNATLSGHAVTFCKNLSEHKGHMLHTCSDCLLWTDTFRNRDVTARCIMQFTRTGKPHPKNMEMFKKQVKCLNFPEDFHSYDGETKLCPDDREKTERGSRGHSAVGDNPSRHGVKDGVTSGQVASPD